MLVVGSGLLALVLSLAAWPMISFAVTIAHEGGHAISAAVMGGKVESIHVHRRRNPIAGVTKFRGVGPFGTFLTALAGYLGPSVFGLLGALMLTRGKTVVVLWLSLIFLLLALIQSGNLVGAIAIVALGTVIVVILRDTAAGTQSFLAYTWIWCLLFGGFGHVLTLQRARGQGADSGSDVVALRKMSLLPASLWSGFFWLLTLAALIYGGLILLGVVKIGG
jgi:hypothetical protein